MDMTKEILRGTFIAIQSYLMKWEKSQINNLTLQLKQLEKEEETKAKVSRRKESLIWGQKQMKIIEKINETKSFLFEKIGKIDKPLPRLIKKKKGRGLKSIKLKWKRSYNGHHRNTKVHKRLLQATICQ